MTGMQIQFNGEVIRVYSDLLAIVFSLLKIEDREEISLDIRGSNDFFEERLNWGSWKLERGDEFQIKIVEIDEITKPWKRENKKASEEELKKELAHYHELKLELENANLL
jgi:hypothetical protein